MIHPSKIYILEASREAWQNMSAGQGKTGIHCTKPGSRPEQPGRQRDGPEDTPGMVLAGRFNSSCTKIRIRSMAFSQI